MAVIALDLGGTRIKFGLVQNNQLLSSSSMTVPSSESFASVLPAIENEVKKLMQQTGISSLEGIGMAFPTIVDSDNMKLLYKYVKYNDANDIDLQAWAQRTWKAPLYMENDARAALVGEWQYGHGKGSDHLIMITIGTGVGSAALVNGKLLKGSHYLAGNLGGHQIINFDGHRCNCGNQGCLESEASSWALEAIVKSQEAYEESRFANVKKIDFELVFKWAKENDKFAIGVRDRCMDVWSAGILNLVYAYDPDRIVISGGVMHSADVILPYLQNKLNQASWLPEQAVQVVAAKEPDWAGVLGMAYLAAYRNNYK